MEKFEDLLGQTFANVSSDNRYVNFVREDGSGYQLYHDQDCCESVYVEDIEGDLHDLEGTPILFAEESSNEEAPEGSPRRTMMTCGPSIACEQSREAS